MNLTYFSRQYKLPQEPCSISDVIVEVVLGQVEDIETEQFGLLGVGNVQLGRQVDGLQLDNVFL